MHTSVETFLLAYSVCSPLNLLHLKWRLVNVSMYLSLSIGSALFRLQKLNWKWKCKDTFRVKPTCTEEVKHCLCLLFVGKQVHTRKLALPVPDIVPERKRSTPINPANTIRKCLSNNPVSQRPFRDRIIHLLALRSYKKLEVLARLQRDGINQKDRNSLGTTLQQVFWYSFGFDTVMWLLNIYTFN